jgi:hypothetical protein
MTAKQFAEKYAGKQIKFINSVKVGIVVGYTEVGYICIELINTANAWSSNEARIAGATLIFPCMSFSRHAIETLELMHEPVKPYPHKCKVCHSPARKTKNTYMCSNVKCKTWKKVRKQAAVIKNKDTNTDKDGFVICPACSSFVFETMYVSENYITDTGWLRNNECKNGHKWQITWRDGYKLKLYVFSADGSKIDENTYYKWVFENDHWSWIVCHY